MPPAPLPSAGDINGPTVPRRAQQRVRRRGAVGLDRVQPDDVRTEAAPTGAGPHPPTSEEAAQIVAAALADDAEWGALVWLYLVTCARRGEILALRWEHLDVAAGVVMIRGSASEQDGTTTIKSTKTHQSRRISLDAATLTLLVEHRERVIPRCNDIGAGFDEQRFIVSCSPDHSRPGSPSGVTHRPRRMVGKLGIRTASARYSPLQRDGVARLRCRPAHGGRAGLGHGSGGVTTLKVCAAWVARADQQASELLAARLPTPPPSS